MLPAPLLDTRSSRLFTKVTPAARMTCRSTGRAAEGRRSRAVGEPVDQLRHGQRGPNAPRPGEQ